MVLGAFRPRSLRQTLEAIYKNEIVQVVAL